MKKKKERENSQDDGTEAAKHFGKYVNLMNDVAFQWVFGQESNKDLLMALLNELIPELHIEGLDFYRQRQQSFAKDLKKSVFDVSCRLADGTYVDVEVQVRSQDWFADRCLYYSTYCIQSQIGEGNCEYRLKPVYVVSIDAFTRKHGPDWDGSILSSYSLREDSTHELMTDSLHFVFVELDRFDKKWEDIDNDRERFYFCIRHLHRMKNLPDGFAEGIWAKLARQSELAEMPSRVKTKYIRTMTTEIDRRAQEKYARRIALEEQMAACEAAREAARETGRAEGRADGEARLVKAMLSKGMEAASIADITGLDISYVEELCHLKIIGAKR